MAVSAAPIRTFTNDPVQARALDKSDIRDLRRWFVNAAKRSKDAGHQYLVFTIDEDYCFYPEEQANLVGQLKPAGISPLYFTVHTDKGHDSFLLEPALYTPQIQALLNS